MMTTRNIAAACCALIAVTCVVLNFIYVVQDHRNRVRGIPHHVSTVPLVTWIFATWASLLSAFGSVQRDFGVFLLVIAIIDPSFWVILWRILNRGRADGGDQRV